MSMKKYIGGLAIAATFFSSTAFAADVVAPEVIPVFSWTGAYIGLNAGFGGGKAKHPFDVSGPTEVGRFNIANGTLDFTSSGFLGGIQAGYNYQMDQWVLGVETDFQGSGIKGEGSVSVDSPIFGGSFNAKIGSKLDWYGTLRARAGVLATDRFLVYATGGLAYGRTKSYVNIDEIDLNESRSKTKAGWTIGAGAEYAITDNVTFKTEYLYTDLGKANLFDGEFGDSGIAARLDRKFNFHTVRVGINYKF
jgi:outer membrane immunogenic protein